MPTSSSGSGVCRLTVAFAALHRTPDNRGDDAGLYVLAGEDSMADPTPDNQQGPAGHANSPVDPDVFLRRLDDIVRRAVACAMARSGTGAGPQVRWLSPKMLARYIARDVKGLSALVRAGKLPTPSYHLGRKSPRFDRLAVDAILCGDKEKTDAEEITSRAIQRMRAEHEDRSARPQRRHRTGV
jgi:hypothetical protein